MLERLKWVASKLPRSFQRELKRLNFWWQINRGEFLTDEPEFSRLDRWVSEGDWVMDVGANVGHYTKRLSELVGEPGRVFAFEPMAETFELLVSNLSRFSHSNVVPFNIAASDEVGIAVMSMPKFKTGLDNYYQARVGAGLGGGHSVLKFPLGRLFGDFSFKLIKIDVEGHEHEAVTGLLPLIEKAKPVLIVEGFDESVERLLERLGYRTHQFVGSPNRVFVHASSSAKVE